MNYETFDNDTDPSDANYFDFVKWLSKRTAAELEQTKGNREETRKVLCRYYKRGLRANLTTSELVDFLGVSSPSVLEEAGLNDEEGDEVMALSGSLTDEEINQTMQE